MRLRMFVLALTGGVRERRVRDRHAGRFPPSPIRSPNRTEPTGVYFAHDGRVFVTEKSGLIWVYQNLLDTHPAVFADISANVHDYWDRGLLGFALDPRFPEQPYVYVEYSFNGGLFDDPPPRWPEFNCTDPTDPGAGCVISGHISRLTVDGNTVGAGTRAGRGLVPAVSEPFDRHDPLRSGRLSLRRRRRRREFRFPRSRPERQLRRGPTNARRRTKAGRCARKGSKTKPRTPARSG